MQCNICFRPGGFKLPFLCPIDARNVLYEPRMANARVLLDKCTLDKQITAAISGEQAGNTVPTEDLRRWNVDRNIAESDLAVDRTEQIMAQADELRSKIEVARAGIAQRKAAIIRRRSEMESATNGLEQRRTRQIEELDKSTKMKKYKWNQVHLTSSVSRAFLCAEAAKLYGLRRIDNGDTLEYSIAGIPIVDLQSMNKVLPAPITTTLSHIAHLLVLATHYLSLRLPAEITLPHRDYPLPTILPIASSHIHTNLPFPGTSFQSSNNSPSTSRHVEVSTLPRPRPLYITKPLPILSKEDPSAHSLFLEGATLLAYDVAWVCKTQGISIETSGITTFEDIYAIGRNLFNLLIGTSPRPSPRTASISSTPSSTPNGTPSKRRDASDPIESGPENSKKPVKVFGATMGQFSHGTSHTFLCGLEGTEFLRTFKLPAPLKVATDLKKHLSNEATSAEWEYVEEDAWAVTDGNGLDDDGVVVGARRLSGRVLGGGIGGAMQSFMSMRTVMDAVEVVDGKEVSGDRKPGTSGWTKLKPR